jgi:hypothetical protein
LIRPPLQNPSILWLLTSSHTAAMRPSPNSGRVRHRKKPQQRDTFLTEAAQASWINADGCYSHSERRLSPKTMRFKTGLAKGYAMVDFPTPFPAIYRVKPPASPRR